MVRSWSSGGGETSEWGLVILSPRGWLYRKIRVCSDEGFEARIRLWVWDFPRKTTKDHAKKYDGDRPYIGLPRIVWLVIEDLGGKIWIASYDASCWSMSFTARVMEYGCSAKVDELDDVLLGHDTVVKFEVPVCESHFVEVLHAVTDLAKDAVDFWTTHFAGHDHREEVVRSELHDLVIVAMVVNDIDGLDDIRVLERRADTELCGDLLLVLLF
jgi:hypothetical protein